LYELACGLRNQASGHSDPWDAEDVQRVDAYLRERLARWHKSVSYRDRAAYWDSLMYQLVEAALAEYKA